MQEFRRSRLRDVKRHARTLGGSLVELPTRARLRRDWRPQASWLAAVVRSVVVRLLEWNQALLYLGQLPVPSQSRDQQRPPTSERRIIEFGCT